MYTVQLLMLEFTATDAVGADISPLRIFLRLVMTESLGTFCACADKTTVASQKIRKTFFMGLGFYIESKDLVIFVKSGFQGSVVFFKLAPH